MPTLELARKKWHDRKVCPQHLILTAAACFADAKPDSPGCKELWPQWPIYSRVWPCFKARKPSNNLTHGEHVPFWTCSDHSRWAVHVTLYRHIDWLLWCLCCVNRCKCFHCLTGWYYSLDHFKHLCTYIYLI